MGNEFTPLLPEQIQILIKDPANILRATYIEILALLQDLLGRYSPKGNATVFINAKESEALMYEAISKLRILIAPFEERSLTFQRVTNSLNPALTRLIRITIEFEHANLRFSNRPAVQAIRGVKRFSVSEIRDDNVGPALTGAADFDQIISSTPDSVYQQVNFFIDNRSNSLSVGDGVYPIDGFTFVHFRGALHRQLESGMEPVYDQLMEVIWSEPKDPSFEGTADLAKTDVSLAVQKVVLDCASANIVTALKLKAKCEREGPSKKEPVSLVEAYLDDLLAEYQLLRKPASAGSGPQTASQQKPRGRRKDINL